MKNLLLSISLGISILSHSQWESTEIPEDIFLDEIETLDDGSIIISGYKTDFTGTQAGIYKSEDNGLTWTLVNSFDFAGQHVSKMCWLDSESAYFGTKSEFNDGVLLKTTDQGQSIFWVSGLSGITGIEDLDFATENVGAVITEDYILRRTTNGGASWTSTVFNSSFSPRLVNYLNSNIIYVTGIHTNGDRVIIYKSTDGGNSWTDVVQISSNNVSIIDFGVKNKAYLSYLSNGFLNVWNSTDGNNWNYISLNESLENVNSMSVFNSSTVHFTSFDSQKDSSVVYTVTKLGEVETNYVTQDTKIQGVYFENELQAVAIGDNGTIFNYSGTTSIEDNQLKDFNTQYYNGQITWFKERNTKVEIYTLTGQLISTETFYDNSYQVTGLNPSIYIARVLDINSGIKSTIKFIVQ